MCSENLVFEKYSSTRFLSAFSAVNSNTHSENTGNERDPNKTTANAGSHYTIYVRASLSPVYGLSRATACSVRIIYSGKSNARYDKILSR